MNDTHAQAVCHLLDREFLGRVDDRGIVEDQLVDATLDELDLHEFTLDWRVHQYCRNHGDSDQADCDEAARQWYRARHFDTRTISQYRQDFVDEQRAMRHSRRRRGMRPGESNHPIDP